VKLSTKGRYAVMAMADLAIQSGGRPVSLADIADRQEISLSYLEQLFGKLRRSSLVKSVRGPGGGYMLGRTAEEMRISDIVLAVDEPLSVMRCQPGSPAGCQSNKGRCLTHDLWEELTNQIHLYLASVSLDDVISRRVLGTSGLVGEEFEDRPRNEPAITLNSDQLTGDCLPAPQLAQEAVQG
jgi:Rrf2 family transcriptional regulator, iron-sulfur cluster assembly transcription factor